MNVVPVDIMGVEVLCHEPGKARERILALEAAMRAEIAAGNFTDTKDEMPLEHLFVPGVYARKLTIPAGNLVVGKIHRAPCFNVVTRGRITVLTEEGVKMVEAPAFFRSEAGVKRVGLAHTDTVWITLHGTEETEPDRLEAELVCETYEEIGLIEAKEPVACLG